MRVLNMLETYSEKLADRKPVEIRSDPIWTDRVWVVIGDRQPVCLMADELRRAITNALNHK